VEATNSEQKTVLNEPAVLLDLPGTFILPGCRPGASMKATTR